MSSIDDIIQGVGAAIDRIGEAASTLAGVEQETDQALDLVMSVGAQAAVDGYTRLKADVEQLLTQVAAAGEAAKEVLLTARAVADGT